MPSVTMFRMLTIAGAALAPPQIQRVVGREAVVYSQPVAELCAEAILAADGRIEKAILSAALARDLRQRVGSQAGSGALWVVEDDECNVVGSVAIEISRLSPAALDEQRLGRNVLEAGLADRPLLSSLAVSPAFRRRGLAKSLCREAEALAKSWGYDEVLLKVERDNSRARSLYRKLGYRMVSIDKDAERPEAGPGGIKYVPTVQVAMRKSLRYPPLDSVVVAATAATAAVLLGMRFSDEAAVIAGLVANGRGAAAAERLREIVLSLLPIPLPL